MIFSVDVGTAGTFCSEDARSFVQAGLLGLFLFVVLVAKKFATICSIGSKV
jgi:hypothetical protein